MKENNGIDVTVDKDEVRDEIIYLSSSVGKSRSFTAFLFIIQAAVDRYEEIFGEPMTWTED